jgi:hypothetical protein
MARPIVLVALAAFAAGLLTGVLAAGPRGLDGDTRAAASAPPPSPRPAVEPPVATGLSPDWKADALTGGDPARRERALAQIAAGLRATDPSVAAEARRALAQLAEAATPPAAAGVPTRTAPRPEGPPGDHTRAVEQVAALKADVLQIEDPARRERGLADLEEAIQSGDPALAAAALRALPEFRDVPHEKSRFRGAVRARLDDGDANVRSAAACALRFVDAEPADTEALLRVAESHPEHPNLLYSAMRLAGRRVEGRLADLYVRALSASDASRAEEAANGLRGVWVSEEVENAALSAFERTGSRNDPGLWWHILGQIRPTRERRVRFIFDVLRSQPTDMGAPQLFARALESHNLEPSAAPVAAALALALLPDAQTNLVRELCLEVLEKSGTAAEASGLCAFADNRMVERDLRVRARAIAHALDRLR